MVKNATNRAMYFTNAKTFEEFTKMNKVKLKSKKEEVDTTEEQWKKYLNKYYLSIRKVKPLMKKDEGMRLLSPQKIGLISNLKNNLRENQEEDFVEKMKKVPFRTHSKKESRHHESRELST